MTRRPRIDFPGAFHHVYARGIEKRDIFIDPGDRAELRHRISKNIKRFNASCLAWAFMPNHFHLLYHSESGNLSDFMRCLMSGYSTYFNRKHVRSGHLFQNRYKSTVVDSERYLLESIRYIHLNPVRSGIVTSTEALSRYPWTGHHEIIASGRLPWAKFPIVQEFFSSMYLKDVDIYLSFLEEGLCHRSGESWSESVIGQVRARPRPVDIASEADKDGDRANFLDVVDTVCGRLMISKDRILNGRRDRISSLARREILRECLGRKRMAFRSVCKCLGITHAGGSYLMKGTERPRLSGST